MIIKGQKFGRLTVIAYERTVISEGGYTTDIYKVKCDCGTITSVRRHGNTIKTKSCGCLKREIARERCKTLNKVTDFFQYVKDNHIVNEITGCWEWTGTLWANGYARTGIKYSKQTKGRAYRLTYELFKEPIKEGMIICHKCDNIKCVNPDHLFQGTEQDNLTDMINKGRSLAGSKHPNSALTEETVKEILSRANESCIKLGREYGVSDCCIRDIIKGRNWKHVQRDIVVK